VNDFLDAPALVILVFALGAVLFSALGVLPHYAKDALEPKWLGVAEALASGCMLGLGYLLLAHETDAGWRPVLGAGLGALTVYGVQRFFGFRDMEPDQEDEETEGAGGYRAMLYGSLHAGMEGAAIGAAVLSRVSLGIFLAIALALHNVAESVTLTQMLRNRGVTIKDAGGLCVMVKLPQTLMGLSVFAVVSAVPWLLPWVLGFAAGSLFYIILTDLLPGAYRHSKHLSVAVLTSVAAALVVLFEGALG
jgi:zinc transporter ZupT